MGTTVLLQPLEEKWISQLFTAIPRAMRLSDEASIFEEAIVQRILTDPHHLWHEGAALSANGARSTRHW